MALLVLAETVPVLSARFLAFMSSVTFFRPLVTESPCSLTYTTLALLPQGLPRLLLPSNGPLLECPDCS